MSERLISNKVVARKKWQVTHTSNGSMWGVCEAGGGEMLADFYGERARENARLFAAAPELLEALQLVVDTYGFDPSVDSAIWRTANAAIAKAKG